ncbi:MAG: RimK family alpha-L-glutamate ligase [Candidatus Delongbacteria bacterium]|nr:RimK family alpha-L-glutamate ligase [Candidatus Delongbacteria bacterium]
MRIGILTATITESDFFPNIIELKDTAEKRGHSVDIFRNGEFNLFVENGATKLFYNQKAFFVEDYDIVLNRISVREKSNAEYYVANEFINKNITFFNTPDAIAKARNKLLSLQIMAKLGVNLTRSAIIRRPEDLEFAVSHFNYPLVLKNIFGSLGSSTLLIYDIKQLRSTFDYLWNINRNEVILIQEYIESDDRTISDFRVFVLGDEVVASMKRTNSDNDFRANYKKGAAVKLAEITELEKEQCLAIAKEFGLDIAGVDFIRTKNGPVFLEVNSNPGIEGIRKATQADGFDILDKIVDYLEKRVKN